MCSRCPRLLALVTGLVMVVASCTSDDAEIEARATSDTTPPSLKVVVTAEDFFFRVPPRIPAGLVEIEIDNEGKEPHQAQVARLREGVTIQALSGATAQNDPAPLIEMVDVVGGPNSVAPGRKARVVDELTSGSYVLICFLFSQDGREHS